MNYLTTVRGVLETALTAATGRIGTFLQDEDRLSTQFYIPAMAFYLGCLAIIMAIVGTEAPRVWWDDLSADLKALVLALAGLLLALLAETSRHLAMMVRRLYSGEWPPWFPWQTWRERFLRERDERASIRNIQQLAYSQFFTAHKKLVELGSSPNTTTSTAGSLCAVPNRQIARYQLIRPEDVEMQRIKGSEAIPQDSLRSLGYLIGRYALQPLPIGKPVLASLLGSIPEEKYLGEDREVVTLKLSEAEPKAHVQPGVITKLWIKARGTPDIKEFDDLFVLACLQTDEIVVTVQKDQFNDLLRFLHLRESLTFSTNPRIPDRELTGIPVAKNSIAPGQLIQASDISWDMVEKQAGDKRIFDPDGLENRVYWPEVETARSQQSMEAHPEGNGFRKSDIWSERPDRHWLLDEVEPASYRSRVAYRLSLSPCIQYKGPQADMPRKLESSMLAKSNDSSIVEAYPLASGDVLEVVIHGDPKLTFKRCYVYQVQRENNAFIDIAVPNSIEFGKAIEESERIVLSPFSRVPVLPEKRSEFQLTQTEEKLEYIEQRTRNLGPNVRLHAKDVADHYVARSKVINAGEPIAFCDNAGIDVLIPAKPIDQKYMKFPLPSSPDIDVQSSAEPDGQNRVNTTQITQAQRGDFVTIQIESGQYKVGPWFRAFVGDRTEGGELQIAIPTSESDLVEKLLNDEPVVSIDITHSDTLVQEKLSKLKSLLVTQDFMRKQLNRLLSDPKFDVQELGDLSKTVVQCAESLTAFHDVLKKRQWAGDDREEGFYRKMETMFWAELLRPFRDSIAPWPEEVLDRLYQQGGQADQLRMPDKVADIRPTQLGNILAAAAEHPLSAYHIDTGTILTRLIQALDKENPAYKRLRSAENSLTLLLLFSFWSAVWAVFGSAALLIFRGVAWMFPVVLLSGSLLWWVTKEAATAQAYAYGDALKALFDLERRTLFAKLGVQFSDEEIQKGMTPEQESKYWFHLYHLIALGNASDKSFPKLKPDASQKEG